MRHNPLAAWVILLCVASVAPADVLVLTSGEEVAGDVRRTIDRGRDGYLVTDADGNERFVRLDRVLRHVIGRDTVDPPTSAPGASEDAVRLESLRRATSGLEDIGLILSKYDDFLDNALDPAVVIAANADRRTWQRRLDEGFVKVGDDWLTPADRDARLATTLAQIDAARQAVEQDAVDADALVQDLLAEPLTQPAGAYLSGCLALRAGELSSARQHFERVRAIVPDHAPTLVNLAAVQARLDRPERATWFMAEAVEAAPDRRAVLDRAAELLHLLTGERDRNAERLATAFERHDAVLRRQMEGEGLYRYGATWIDADRQRALEAERAGVEQEVAALKQQYDALAAEVRLIDREMSANAATMRQIEAQSTIRDPDGRLIRLPLPADHARLEAENRRLALDRQRLATEAGALEAEASQKRQAIEGGAYLGEVQPIGAEGVPVP